MKIRDRLLLVQAAVAVDKVKSTGDLGTKVGNAAEAAMLGGIASDAWKAYMSLFADSADQLKRLTTTELDGEGTDEAVYLPRVRAYIVANGICAPGTDAITVKNLMGINANIDSDKPDGDPLSTDPDINVTNLRPFIIPAV
ncbi:MAG: hypothetical protein QOH49_3302 [Acidobacteriota bacterium]|jgi:hypothetical protein|nr:hypothetical protein [Acidobacteriota bacterium]